MAREVEVKIKLEESEAKLLNAWLKQNAEYVKEVHYQEYYLDNPNATFFFTHKAGYKDAANYLRVRLERIKHRFA